MSQHQTSTTQARVRRGELPCRGANLGGWLVAEHWMTWDAPMWQGVPEDTCNQGEFATMRFLGHARGDAAFAQHRATWIQEQDIAEIKASGLNTVRVPIGYWIMGEDPTDVSNKREWQVFAPGALVFLDKLVNEWCVKHDLAVLVDIHAAKGSQNGRDHSAAPTPGVKYWGDYPENVDNTVLLAKFIAQRYSNSSAFLGIGLLNEPEYPVNPSVVIDYFQRAYKAVRETGTDCILVTSPMLTEQCPPHMQDVLRGSEYFNVWHEWHPYFLWGHEGQNADQLIASVYGYGQQLDSWQGNSLMLSEWSLGAPASAFPTEDRQRLARLAAAQVEVFMKAKAGWTFWSWKHSDDQNNRPCSWSLRQVLREGVMKVLT